MQSSILDVTHPRYARVCSAIKFIHHTHLYYQLNCKIKIKSISKICQISSLFYQIHWNQQKRGKQSLVLYVKELLKWPPVDKMGHNCACRDLLGFRFQKYTRWTFFRVKLLFECDFKIFWSLNLRTLGLLDFGTSSLLYHLLILPLTFFSSSSSYFFLPPLKLSYLLLNSPISLLPPTSSYVLLTPFTSFYLFYYFLWYGLVWGGWLWSFFEF